MREDNVDKNVINAYNGGQVIVANDNATVYAVQNNSKVITDNINNCEKFQKNKKQDYIDNWNSRLFLHVDNNERPITLADAFIVPDYDYRIKVGSINFSDDDTMDEVIKKFMKYNKSANMIITGVPGIGKTSIVAWMANEYKESDDVFILRFRDWEKEELNIGLLKSICNTLNCSKRDLENKVIILDGFDEIKALKEGETLLRNFLNDNLDYRNFKIIVTSRTGYIDNNLFQYAFELMPFRANDIKDFYFKITDNILNDNLDHGNLDILGIPVILYMAIMSEIDITKNATKAELYNRIFAEKGGIFDKFSDYEEGYDYGNQLLRDEKNIIKYLGFLQETAFKMFDENNLSIPRKEDEIPKLTFQGAEISVLEFPIKHLFENAATNIEFVHKSIYEYFVSEYIIQNICSLLDSNDYKEKIASFFGKKLLHGTITCEIFEFLTYKIKRSNLNHTYNKVAESFQLMLEDGMLYHTNMCYKKAIECEMTVFANMLEVLHLWKRKFFYFTDAIFDYIKYKCKNTLNLSRADLSKANLIESNLKNAKLMNANLSQAKLMEADLSGADLMNANLSQAKLIGARILGADLSGADLSGADLSRADLSGADLSGAKLIRAKLGEAKLSKTLFDENQVGYLKGKYRLDNINVLLNYTNQVIDYMAYCRKEKFFDCT